jgi:hypothetical protein
VFSGVKSFVELQLMKSLVKAHGPLFQELFQRATLFHRPDPLLANFLVLEAYINFKGGRQFVSHCPFYITRAFAQSSSHYTARDRLNEDRRYVPVRKLVLKITDPGRPLLLSCIRNLSKELVDKHTAYLTAASIRPSIFQFDRLFISSKSSRAFQVHGSFLQ